MARLIKQLLYLLSLCWLLQAAGTMAQDDPGPAELLQDVTDRILAEIRTDPGQLRDVNRVRALAERYVLPHIDFRAASQWVLGKYWRTASNGQRARFVGEFRQLLLNTYIRSISNYRENRVSILPARGTPGTGRAEVDAEIEQSGGPPVHLSFRMHKPGPEWLVYDITVEGISLVATHRSSFAKEIHDSGLDSLIEHLADMNAEKAAAPEPATTAGPATP